MKNPEEYFTKMLLGAEDSDRKTETTISKHLDRYMLFILFADFIKRMNDSNDIDKLFDVFKIDMSDRFNKELEELKSMQQTGIGKLLGAMVDVDAEEKKYNEALIKTIDEYKRGLKAILSSLNK